MRKTIVVHIDGLPTHPMEELGRRTLLQGAQIPHLNNLARHGELGRLGVPREPRPFTGELALVSLLGHDSQKWYVGPGAFEALNLEVVLDRNDVAFLCDFVTLRAKDGWGDGKKLGSSLIMDDIAGGGLETEDARELIDAINEQLISENIQFYLGQHARHLMVWAGGHAKIGCGNPQEAIGKPINTFLPTGEGSKILCELMEASRLILRHHPVNQERVNAGLKPANCLWPWGQSKPVELPPIKDRWPIQGVIVSENGPYRGVAMASGLKTIEIENCDENEQDWLGRMAELAVKVIEKQDLVCLHVPFSVWMVSGEQLTSSPVLVKHLQNIDEYLIGQLQQFCMGSDGVGLFVMTTPPGVKHVGDDVHSPAPYVLFEGQTTGGQSSLVEFHEQEVANHPLKNATILFERFFGKT